MEIQNRLKRLALLKIKLSQQLVTLVMPSTIDIDVWLSTADFAELAGFKNTRNARQILANALNKGEKWRGHELKVKVEKGRGGRGGQELFCPSGFIA
jgi:hypothetical protein